MVLGGLSMSRFGAHIDPALVLPVRAGEGALNLPSPPSGGGPTSDPVHYVSLAPPVLDIGEGVDRITSLKAIKDRCRQMMFSKELTSTERSLASTLESLSMRLIEIEEKKPFAKPELREGFEKRLEEGLRTIGRKHFMAELRREPGMTSVRISEDGTECAITRYGTKFTLQLSPALQVTSVTSGSGTLSFSSPPSASQLSAALRTLPDTMRELKRRYASIPEDAMFNLQTGLVSFTHEGAPRLALGTTVLAPLEGVSDDRRTRDAAAAELRSRRTMVDSADSFLRRVIERDLRAGKFPDNGSGVPALLVSIDRVRERGSLDSISLAGLPPDVTKAFERLADAAGRARVAGDALAALGGSPTESSGLVRVLGRGAGAWEYHIESSRVLLVSRDARDAPERVLILSRHYGSSAPVEIVLKTECERLAKPALREGAVLSLRLAGSLAVPALREVAENERLNYPTRRAALMLLAESGVKTVTIGGEDRPVVSVLASLMPSAPAAWPISLAKALASDPAASAAAIRSILQNPKSTPFALSTAAGAARILRDPALVDSLLPLLKHSDPKVAQEAALALGTMGRREAIPLLRTILIGPAAGPRVEAGLALLNFGRTEAEFVATHAAKVPSLSERAVDVLLRDKNPHIGIFLRRHFRHGDLSGMKGNEEAALLVLERAGALGNRDAIRDLLLIGSDRSIPSARSHIKVEGHTFTVEVAVADCLSRIGNPQATARLATALASSVSGDDRLHCRARLLEIARSRKLGLEHIERFAPDLREMLMSNRENDRPDKRPLAVLVYPKSDYNGAFGVHSRHVRDMVNAGYRVILHEASTAGEAVEALKSATRRQSASLVVLSGHGTQSSIRFGHDSLESRHRDIFLSAGDPRGEAARSKALSTLDTAHLTTSQVKLLREAVPSGILRNDGHLVLISCSVGSGREWKKPADMTRPGADVPNNITNLMAELFPHPDKTKRIWSSTVDTNLKSLRFDPATGRLLEAEYHAGPKNLYRVERPRIDDGRVLV